MLRGAVYDPVVMSVVPVVEDAFGFAEMQVVSFADLYAGKIVAAFDRQHPRDLFDVRSLLANEGVGDELRRAFLIYVISHNRPMAEVLAPTRKPLDEEFARGFAGLTQEPVVLADLEAAREAIIAALVADMPEDHRRFLPASNAANRIGHFSGYRKPGICPPSCGSSATSPSCPMPNGASWSTHWSAFCFPDRNSINGPCHLMG